MYDSRPNPFSLKIVAWLFILAGICSVIKIVVSLLNGDLFVDLSVISLFVGRGLLRRSRGWRTCALVLLWLAMIAVPLVGVAFIMSPAPIHFHVFGLRIGQASVGFGIAMVVFVFLLALWQYRVLVRPDVRELFGYLSAPPKRAG